MTTKYLEEVKTAIEKIRNYTSIVAYNASLLDEFYQNLGECIRLKELVEQYEKEHDTAFQEWKKIIKKHKKVIKYLKKKKSIDDKILVEYEIDTVINMLEGDENIELE